MGVEPGETMRVDLIGDIDGGDELVQTYQFTNEGQNNVSAAGSLADAVEILTGLWTIVEQLLSTLAVFRRIRAQNVQTFQLLGVEFLDPTLDGSRIEQMAPRQATAVLSFPTDVPRVIMKKMFGPITDDSCGADGILTEGMLSLLASTGAELLTLQEMTFSDWMFSYVSPKTLSVEYPVGAQFISAPGARRSRKPGVGS
jgi:hypothetical protein